MQPTDFAKGKTWAMLPEKFGLVVWCSTSFRQIILLSRKLAGFADATDGPPYYDVRDSVAIIPVSRLRTKKRTFWSFLFGGSSYAEIARTVAAAA